MKREEPGDNQRAEEFIPCEMFLEQTGFFSPSSKRLVHLFNKEKTLRRRMPDGQVVETKLTIDALQRFGLPITFDQDLYRAFLKICDEVVDEYGKLPQPIEVPTKKLLRYAGKASSQRDRRAAMEWFEVMRGTQLKGEIYNHRKGKYEAMISGVFAQAVLRGELMPDGEPATRNFVWLSPWFKDNYEFGFVRKFDLNFYNSLRKPIAKALYALLEVGWYASSGKPYAKSYPKLCEEFLLRQHRYPTLIHQQLEPAFLELQEKTFLERWTIEKGRREFVVTFEPGEKWFEDQKARLKRKRQQTGKTVGERDDQKGREILVQEKENRYDAARLKRIEISNEFPMISSSDHR